jgi:hypothetical protein
VWLEAVPARAKRERSSTAAVPATVAGEVLHKATEDTLGKARETDRAGEPGDLPSLSSFRVPGQRAVRESVVATTLAILLLGAANVHPTAAAPANDGATPCPTNEADRGATA